MACFAKRRSARKDGTGRRGVIGSSSMPSAWSIRRTKFSPKRAASGARGTGADYIQPVGWTGHAGNAKTARKDRGVGGWSTKLRDEARHAMVLQQHQIGRRQIPRDDDHALKFLVWQLVTQRRVAQQIAKDAVDDVVDIVLARAQIRVFHFLEHRDQ